MTTKPAKPSSDPDNADEVVDRIEGEEWAQHEPAVTEPENGSAPQPADDQRTDPGD